MAGFGMIAEGFKKIFSGPQIGVTHICLFALSGIISVVSIMMQNAVKAKAFPGLDVLIIGIILFIAVSIYLGGYTYKFMHNSFYPERESYLPDFDGEPFKLFLKALPLAFVWGLYYIVLGLLCFVVKILIIPVIFMILIIAPFISFIFVAFSKHFETKGLYNPVLPFKFFPEAFGDVIVLGLCFIPIWIISAIPSMIIGVMIGLSGAKADNSFAIYASGIIGGYLGILFQYVWCYCLVQIFKEKLENIVE